jgi:hypothetical protein
MIHELSCLNTQYCSHQVLQVFMMNPAEFKMYAKVPRLLGTDYKADEGVEDAYLKSVYGVGVKIMARAQKDKSAPDKMLLQDLQKQLEQELANIDAGTGYASVLASAPVAAVAASILAAREAEGKDLKRPREIDDENPGARKKHKKQRRR